MSKDTFPDKHEVELNEAVRVGLSVDEGGAESSADAAVVQSGLDEDLVERLKEIFDPDDLQRVQSLVMTAYMRGYRVGHDDAVAEFRRLAEEKNHE